MFRKVGGIFLTAKELNETGNWGKAQKWVRRIAALLNAKPYLYGGSVRDWLLKKLHITTSEGEGDFDVLLACNYDLPGAVRTVATEFPKSIIMIVSDDTFRLQEGDTKVDFKVTTDPAKATYDFTINAILAPLEPLMAEGKTEVFAYNLDDIENLTLRHIAPFSAYPFHMVRGIRLASEFKLTIHPTTLQAYRKSIKFINNVPEPLIHRELARAVTRGYDRAVVVGATTGFIPTFLPPLAQFARKHTNQYTEHIQRCANLFHLFNPKNQSKEAKEVRQYAPAKVLQKEFAPAGRNLLYCYYIAAYLLPIHPQAFQQILIDRNFYPAERGIITLCVTSVQNKIPPEKAHTFVKPFLIALGKVV